MCPPERLAYFPGIIEDAGKLTDEEVLYNMKRAADALQKKFGKHADDRSTNEDQEWVRKKAD